MKILQANLFLTPLNINQSKSYARLEVSADTFEKNSESLNLSFKGSKEKIFSEVVANPKRAQRVMGLTLLSAMALDAGVEMENHLTEETAKKNTDNPYADFWERMFGGLNQPNKELEKKVENLEQENSVLKKICQDLQTKYSELKTKMDGLFAELKGQKNEDSSPQNGGKKASDKENNVKIMFPKKHGRLSKAQTYLKSVVESMSFEKGTAVKVNEICSVLIKKDINENINKEELAKNLGKDLESVKDDNEKVNLTVDVYYKKCQLEQKTEQKGVEETQQEDESSVSSQKETETSAAVSKNQESSQTEQTNVQSADSGGQQLFTTNGQTYRCIGRMDLAGQTDRKKRQRIPGKNSSGQPVPVVEISDSAVPNSFTIRLPSKTQNPDLKANLTACLDRFKQKYEESVQEQADKEGNSAEPIKWKIQRPVSKKVLERDVKLEIKSCRNPGNNKTPYEYITEEDSSEIADILNTDERYHEYFGLHGAMKEIERFVDFDSNVPVEAQAKHVTDVLIRTINTALRKGVKIEAHPGFFYDDETKSTRTYIGADLIIPEEYFDKEAVEIFGTYDLRIGISEGWDGSNRNNKHALIGKIYPIGV